MPRVGSAVFSFSKTAEYHPLATAGGSLFQQKGQPREVQEDKESDDRAVKQTEPRLLGTVARNERGVNDADAALSVHAKGDLRHARLSASPGPIRVQAQATCFGTKQSGDLTCERPGRVKFTRAVPKTGAGG